ncbi:MAG: pyrrolo-quinoline quinone [Burkholderiaceae bacterium]|nr:pyrrolo-quinoline quinone [Burkholderiaceae bacterium]
MKSKLQITLALVALSGLLVAPAADATDVARLPLKASVLAKPNVIFGMDDSGSMDWEVLLDTSSGLFWWDGDDGWNSATGKPASATGSNAYRRSYLFPVGTADGGALYGYSDSNGRALAPTAQFAWVRSAAFNPIYYDSTKTYEPWAPAYVAGAIVNYAPAVPAAALSHPAFPAGPTLKLDGPWDATAANWTTNGYRFYMQPGMVVPAGSRVYAGSTSSDVCSGTTTRTLTVDLVVAAGRACYASIPYYPATFWHPENCVVGADCVVAPDGTKLKRYEIKPATAGYPSGRGYAAEMQNFANWFTYYRKRKQMLAGSMGEVLEGLTGLRLGLMRFTDSGVATPAVTMYDTESGSASTNGLRVAGQFYTNAVIEPEGTPTHATIKHIASQYENNPNIIQYACQRNSMFIVTDGFSNTTSIAVPAYDKNKYGGAPPYTDIPNGSLSDLALAYYTNRLRLDLPAGRVPISASAAPNADKNPDLHINTYAISLGVRGSLWPTAVDPFVTPPVWTAPLADHPSLIDDQWHGTINGRGLMYLATNPSETASGIRAVLTDIISQTGAQGGVAVSTVNLARGDNRAYFGIYNPAGWIGDVTAHPIDAATGEVDAAAELWSASATLLARDWTTRVIASATSAGGVGFTVADVGAVVNPGGVHGDTTQVMNYLRGDRTHEGTLFRVRTGLIGAIINSEPAVDRKKSVVYVQSGEGMLHAIDTEEATAGQELWAFVPRSVLASLGETVQRGYVFTTRLDGSPSLGTGSGGKTMLVAGTGAAGRSFHALDVSNPRGLTEATLASRYMWEFPDAADAVTQAKVGLAMGRARIVKTAGDGYVVLVTSGYANDDGRGRLWMLDADTGAIVHEFDTGVGAPGAGDAGLAQVSAFLEDDGTVRYAYGGDLLGNLWRFDLQGKGAPVKLAELRDSLGNRQPVTAAPELAMIENKRVVIVGTGRMLGIGDFGSTRVQTMYAISDGVPLANPRAALVAQVYNPATDSLSSNPVDWSTDRGWYVDLPAGEQANTQPTIAYGAVAFTTNTAGASDCTASSRLYVFDVTSGSKFEGAGFVSTLISDSANSSGVTALATSGQKIVGSGQDSDGNPWEREIVSKTLIDPAKNAWREIRRR